MLEEVWFEFDEKHGQCDEAEYLRTMKFVPVYQEIPLGL